MFDPTKSINNLYNTCDPRDQLAHEIRQFNSFQVPSFNAGIQLGETMEEKLLKNRASQLDPRDSERNDIQMYLNTPLKF